MPISIPDNFKINSETPIDVRIVASNSAQRNNIAYKYDGMEVIQIDNRVTYIWNKSKYLLTGVTSTSWDTNNGIIGQGTPNYIPKWDSNGLGLTNSSIISVPMGFNERSQKIGIGGTPSEAFQINGNYSTATLGTFSMPFVVHKGVNTIIGENWYWDIGLSQDKVFNINFASSTISFKDGGFVFKGRSAGSPSIMSDILVIENNGAVNFNGYISMSGKASAPTANNGSIYYDSNRFKVKESGEWRIISRIYEVYSVLISQSGLSSPTQTVLESTIGSGTWSYVSVGVFNLTITNGFMGITPRISGICGPHTSSGVFFGEKIDNNTYQIRTLFSPGATHSNDMVSNKLIEIRVY